MEEKKLLQGFFDMVFSAGLPSENLWVLDLRTKMLHQLTDAKNRKSYWHPMWSPDGTKIAYVSNQESVADIWVMDRDGSHPTRLTMGDTYDIFPAWSPDGTKIAYSSSKNETTAADVWVLTLEKVNRS